MAGARGGAPGGFGPSSCLWAAAAETAELIERLGMGEYKMMREGCFRWNERWRGRCGGRGRRAAEAAAAAALNHGKNTVFFRVESE